MATFRRWFPPLFLVACVVVGLAYRWTRPTPVQARIAELNSDLAQAVREAPVKVSNYQSTAGDIANLDLDVEVVLRQLPYVVAIERSGPKEHRFGSRIIHFVDWHFVPPGPFVVDVENTLGRTLDAAGTDGLSHGTQATRRTGPN